MKKLLFLIALAGAFWAAWAWLPTRRTPTGQPALVYLTGENLSTFQAAFNNASDRLRLVLLLSPT